MPPIGGNGVGAGGEGAGGTAAGGTGGLGPCADVDVSSDPMNCGDCGNECRSGVGCAGGACRIVQVNDGALALTLDSPTVPQRLVWGHAALGPVETTDIDALTTTSAGAFRFPLELVGVSNEIAMIENPAAAAFDPEDCLVPVWFDVETTPPTMSACTTGACPPASDLAASNELMAWTGAGGTYYRVTDAPTAEFVAGVQATSVAYAPSLRLALAGDGTAGAGPSGALPIRHGLLSALQEPLPVIGTTLYRPKNMAFLGDTLFWITDAQEIACADLAAAQPVAVTYASLPALATGLALYVPTSTLYVAIDDGPIVRGPAVCAPQASMDVLVEPPATSLVYTFSIVATNDRIFFTRTSLEQNPEFGGLYERPLAWPPIGTLDVAQ